MRLEKLQVYTLSMEIAEKIWTIVIKWDYFTKDTIGKQLVRAADSIAANISEGAGRKSPKELRRFLYISFGSLSELETLLIIGKRLGYLDNVAWTDLFPRIKKITSQLSGLIKSLKIVD